MHTHSLFDAFTYISIGFVLDTDCKQIHRQHVFLYVYTTHIMLSVTQFPSCLTWSSTSVLPPFNHQHHRCGLFSLYTAAFLTAAAGDIIMITLTTGSLPFSFTLFITIQEFLCKLIQTYHFITVKDQLGGIKTT